MVVGFVGLGIMGKPMAKNLCKAGYSLIVDEHHKENTDELIKCANLYPIPCPNFAELL